ncbi:MAG: hypothetical protein QOH58_2914 [Thermoleophilaceae bacterium]|nr:hypothetical protein [Thermoleophilaceae bacterium]
MPRVAHWRAHAFVAAAGAVVIAAAPAGAGRAETRGTLDVAQSVAGGAYPEGSISYLRVRRGPRVVIRRSRPGPIRARLHPRPGTYRVTSFQRPCQGDCSGCSGRVRVFAGETSRVGVVTRPGRSCSVAAKEPPAFPAAARVRAARRYVRGRAVTSLALIDSHGRLRGFAARRRYVSASVVKAMLLVAYLRTLGDRGANAGDRALLGPMITRSDNDMADAVYGRVGDAGLLALARRAGMSDLTVTGHWGGVYFSAADQARLFLRIDSLVPRRSRAYARGLLSSIVPYQRWGFSRVARRHGWSIFFKGGWRGTASGRLVHEAALLERGSQRFSLVVLSDGNPSHEYGTETLRGVARRIFR